MKKKLYKAREIIKVKKQIKKMLPQTEYVNVSIDINEAQEFEAMIRVPIDGKADLFAYKKGTSFHESLGKA